MKDERRKKLFDIEEILAEVGIHRSWNRPSAWSFNWRRKRNKNLYSVTLK
jgi:hypothetical protein